MKRALGSLVLDVSVDHVAWRRTIRSPAALCRLAANAAMSVARVKRRSTAALTLTSDRRMRVLNRDFRGYDKPTNVLAFPSGDEARFLGDIAIGLETVRREAKGEGKPIRAHLAHLVVHGVLHLIGYHHESKSAAERMEQLERIALRKLNIPDPYAAAEARR